MTGETMRAFKVPLFFPRSTSSTAVNKTGSWSFLRPGYADRTAPCSAACPCGTDIPLVESLAAEGRLGAAWKAVLMENPLPGVTGRVCFHPCEKACNRGEFDQPVSVNAIERGLADAAADGGADAPITRLPQTGRRVAVIGSGPAGLSAACFLARLGHACEVFESGGEAGGLLRRGIPAYRLPPDVLGREIASITALGVAFHLGVAAGPDFIERNEGRYDAVFVAAGLGKPVSLGVPGEELALDGLAFLASARDGAAPTAAARPGKEAPLAAVIGGGNSAIDAARSLRRLGYRVLVVYRRRREDMPAFAREVESALEEGVGLLQLRRPLELRRDGGGLVLRLGAMREAGAGPDGRARVEPVAGAGDDMRVDAVYTAIGAGPALDWAAFAENETFLSLPRTRLALGGLPVAIGGDLVCAEKSVADAIASGKEAALALDSCFAGGAASVEGRLAAARVGGGSSLSMELYLGGKRSSRSPEVVRFEGLNTDYFRHSARSSPEPFPAAARVSGFAEAERGLPPVGVLAEAARCFSCGRCNGCDNCRTFCPDVSATLGPEGRRIDVDHCKGCGVCVEECPRGAMSMEEGRP